MSSPKPERFEGHVRDVVQSGEGVVETAKGLLFVPGVLAGEQVVVERHARERKGRARLLKLLSSAPERVTPSCPYVVRCGGCALMHASPALQASLRTSFLAQALARAGMFDGEVRYHAAPAALAYRTRARLAFSARAKERTLGFHREGRAELVDIARCEVLVPELDRALAVLRAEVLPLLAGEGEIRLYRGHEGRPAVVIQARDVQTPALYTKLDALVATHGFAGVALYAENASVPAKYGDPRLVSRAADGSALLGPAGGFSQANEAVNAALVARVTELARTEGMRVLELYAGHGNFTVALAPGALAYTAVERAPDALAALRENVHARGLTQVKAVVGEAAAHKPRELDVVVLDPPRTGERGLLTALAAHKPKRIVYVSCDPATLARDLSELSGKGYRVVSADAFDMFPQTGDLESVVCLVRGT